MRATTLAIVVILACGGHTASADKKDEKLSATSKLMAEKLKFAQALLAGVATDDFAKMAASSQGLIRISKADEWTAYKTLEFELLTNNYRLAAETIIRKAKAQNVDGTTLGYLDLTVTCVRCHQHCREVRDTNFVAPAQAEE
jgi:cytochrome c556